MSIDSFATWISTKRRPGFGLVGRARYVPTQRHPRRQGPMAPKAPHFAPTAKRVISLFMQGGPSQVDTYDPKPLLAKLHGQHPPDELRR